MKIVQARAYNGDLISFRKPSEDEFICPVCGASLTGSLPWDEVESTPPSWTPTYDTCPVCITEYGLEDSITSDSPPGAQAGRWDELRIRWLNQAGWPEDKLRQLKENLEIDIDALKKSAGRI
jgi:hypothetical protein